MSVQAVREAIATRLSARTQPVAITPIARPPPLPLLPLLMTRGKTTAPRDANPTKDAVRLLFNR
ncbi:hypothetical protein AB0I54_47000 [Streptomyces sp. NPDC050625]|uniref:hypothetical protein n=1 Tax=Streptomyces sp. NPDC050625 TaxID=3154629 RepID=UPI003422CB50